MILCNGAALDSFSNRCRYATLSTAEAELYALVLIIRRLLCFPCMIAFVIGYSLPPTPVHEDNKAMCEMLERRDLSARSRHVRVNIGFIGDAVNAGEIALVWTPTQEQVADNLTAAEDRVRHMRNRDIMLGGA